MIADNLSVVIPTIGEKSLTKTVNSINNNSIIPHKIHIVIPKIFLKNICDTIIQEKNVIIHSTKFKGQVRQRAFGFSQVKTEFVLQVDSDIILETNCIKNLLNTIKKNPNTSVAPLYFSAQTKKYYSNIISELESIKMLQTVLKKYQGKLSHCLINIGIFYPKIDIPSEWLPGGVIMHRTLDLLKINLNYYPFEGKAYSEDVILCILLKKININLLYSCSSKVYLNHEKELHNFSQYFLFLNKYIRIQYYIAKKYNFSFPCFIFCYVILTIVKKINSNYSK